MSVRWLAVVLLLVSCGGSAEVATTTSIAAAGGCADVIAATAELAGDGTYTFTASVVSDDTLGQICRCVDHSGRGRGNRASSIDTSA